MDRSGKQLTSIRSTSSAQFAYKMIPIYTKYPSGTDSSNLIIQQQINETPIGIHFNPQRLLKSGQVIKNSHHSHSLA
jgi:hypothetical protein